MPATILADPLRLKVYATGSDAVAFLRTISCSIDPFVVRTTDTHPPGGVIVGVLRTAICAIITSFAATPAGGEIVIEAAPFEVAVTDERNVIAGSTTWGRGRSRSSRRSSSHQAPRLRRRLQRSPFGVTG